MKSYLSTIFCSYLLVQLTLLAVDAEGAGPQECIAPASPGVTSNLNDSCAGTVENGGDECDAETQRVLWEELGSRIQTLRNEVSDRIFLLSTLLNSFNYQRLLELARGGNCSAVRVNFEQLIRGRREPIRLADGTIVPPPCGWVPKEEACRELAEQTVQFCEDLIRNGLDARLHAILNQLQTLLNSLDALQNIVNQGLADPCGKSLAAARFAFDLLNRGYQSSLQANADIEAANRRTNGLFSLCSIEEKDGWWLNTK